MNDLIRWAKFNLVGALGMGVQLTALALLNRALPGRYLWAAAAALELTLLHNFVWHRRYTWRDRRDASAWQVQLLGFHLSNGLVSMAGNLILTRLLVHGAHLPVLPANLGAIVGCSLANFWLGNRWAFAATSDSRRIWSGSGYRSGDRDADALPPRQPGAMRAAGDAGGTKANFMSASIVSMLPK